MLIEPSLREKGRTLMELRQSLLAKGFFAWAPCTHQESCPLLGHKTDWCHDRIHFDQPEWFSEIEKHLPFKNRTLTMSYLLLSKRAPPERANLGRLVGDFLPEKGKSRQLVCRGSNREYLAWMHKAIEPQELLRGELVEMPKNPTAVANELRLAEVISLVKH